MVNCTINCCGYLFATFGENWATFYSNIWSHCLPCVCRATAAWSSRRTPPPPTGSPHFKSLFCSLIFTLFSLFGFWWHGGGRCPVSEPKEVVPKSRAKKLYLVLGGSPCLVVVVGDSRSEGRGFESQCCMLDGHC